MKWFVYLNTTYYPDAVIVEADDVPAALDLLTTGYYTPTREGVAIFPLDALALWRGDRAITDELECIP